MAHRGIRTETWVVVAGVTGGLLTGMAACAPSPRAQYQARVESTGRPALHAIHHERLAALMRDLDALAYERLPQNYDTEGVRRRLLDDVAAVSANLVASVGAVVEVLPELELPAEDRRVFARLADKLAGQAQLLQDQSEARLVERLPRTLDEIRATCVACHGLFRDDAGRRIAGPG